MLKHLSLFFGPNSRGKGMLKHLNFFVGSHSSIDNKLLAIFQLLTIFIRSFESLIRYILKLELENDL